MSLAIEKYAKLKRSILFFDKEYKKHVSKSNDFESGFFIKLTYLEISGALEELVDKLILNYMAGIEVSNDNESYIHKLVKKTYSYSYSDAFMKLLVSVLGIKEYDDFERGNIDLVNHIKSNNGFKEILDKRNIYSHTSSDETRPMQTYDSPLVIYQRYKKCFMFLERVEERLNDL
ncbi:hypothetical protein KRX11_06590 [Pasteurellaceae bacterium TAE3-ERU1]|nr:hypothetical protein [Pasteurellaceae bacterium TAE3-ERU1]